MTVQKELINYGQIWLARVAAGPCDRPRIMVVQITGANAESTAGLRFRNLESETPFDQADERDMSVFELISLVKN